MRVEDEVKRLMEIDDDLSRLKLDVIRVLAIFNGVSWVSEIIPDLIKLRGGVFEYPLREDLLDKAIRELESDEIILVEPRMRGMPFSRQVYEDKLVKLRDLQAARRTLSRDPVYGSYVYRQMELIRRALEDHV
ncbi:MAG: hypothetical protein L2C94_000730 [Aigarchaeota archaeon]|jgi:hypothetical protein|nr:hypothetical protein [Candidatus Wolframiiraptor gerlachensis]